MTSPSPAEEAHPAPLAADQPPGDHRAATPALESALPVDTGHIRMHIELPPGACLDIEIEAYDTTGQPVSRHIVTVGGAPAAGMQPAPAAPPAAAAEPTETILEALTGWWHGQLARMAAWRWRAPVLSRRPIALQVGLLWVAVALYAFTRLYDLPAFPIYFFTDEAVQTVKAVELLRDRFMGQGQEFLPTYFENGSQFNLSASVYLQVLPYYFFGKSIWVTRGAAALMTLIAAICVGLTLKNVFKSPYPWLATLALAITPAWFLHSRTAFETSLATSFFAAFLYFYLMYRSHNPRYLYAAVVAGALMFYAYAPARVIIVVMAVLLLLSDWKYHWQQRAVLARGFGLALLLALPFFRFLVNHPQASDWQLRLLGSYWLQERPLLEKLGLYGRAYLRGLDLFYWYLPNQQDLARHLMLDYGHLLRQTLPFGLLGVVVALVNVRSPQHRALLLAALAVPSGAALVNVGITRVLSMVIPAALLTALGFSAALAWLERRHRLARALAAPLVFIVLSAVSLFMLRDALVNGPVWHKDYGLGGMQWGARQLFGDVADYLETHPGARLVVSPSWANGTDVVARFFFGDALPFEMGSAAGYYNEGRPIDSGMRFVMIPEEYRNLPLSRFANVEVERIIASPDGQPAFYYVQLTYAENYAQIIAEEKAARRQLQSDFLPLDGQDVTIWFSQLDMGKPNHLFDGDPRTLVRSNQVNPLQMQFEFPAARSISAMTLRVGGTATRIRVLVWAAGQNQALTYELDLPEVPDPRSARLPFEQALQVERLAIEVYNLHDNSEGHVHLWEISFHP